MPLERTDVTGDADGGPWRVGASFVRPILGDAPVSHDRLIDLWGERAHRGRLKPNVDAVAALEYFDAARALKRPERVRGIGTHTELTYGGSAWLLTDEDVYREMAQAPNPYGDGKATERILSALVNS